MSAIIRALVRSLGWLWREHLWMPGYCWYLYVSQVDPKARCMTLKQLQRLKPCREGVRGWCYP